MQIKEVTRLEVEVRGSATLNQKEMTALVYSSFPKGFRDVLTWEIKATSMFRNTHGDYVITIQPPEKTQHVEGTWYDPAKFDAVIRDILSTIQQKVDAYQQFQQFLHIATHRDDA